MAPFQLTLASSHEASGLTAAQGAKALALPAERLKTAADSNPVCRKCSDTSMKCINISCVCYRCHLFGYGCNLLTQVPDEVLTENVPPPPASSKAQGKKRATRSTSKTSSKTPEASRREDDAWVGFGLSPMLKPCTSLLVD